MNLKNYTSNVPASTSMAKIEKCIVQAGATDISKKYEMNVCIAITFRMMVNNVPVFFQLPAKVEACFDVLWREVKLQVPDEHSKMTLPYIYIEYPAGHPAYPNGSRVPWLASQTDILADDWVIVE